MSGRGGLHNPRIEIPQGRPESATVTYIGIVGAGGGLSGTFGTTAGRIYYFPMKIDTAITIDQLVVEVTAAAGAGNNLRLGIYKADRDWQPTTLVQDYGEIDANSVTVQAITSTQVLPPGRYVLALATEANTTVRRLYNVAGPFHMVLPTFGATPFGRAMIATAAYAVFAATGVVWTDHAADGQAFNYMVLVRVLTP